MKSGVVITGAGLAVAGTGALFIFMGIKNYSFTTVLNAAVRGDPLVAEGVPVARSILPDGTNTLTEVKDTLTDEGSFDSVIRTPGGTQTVGRSLFDTNHFDWGGGNFD